MRGLMLNTHYQPLVPEMTPESLQYISIAQMETDRRIDFFFKLLDHQFLALKKLKNGAP